MGRIEGGASSRRKLRGFALAALLAGIAAPAAVTFVPAAASAQAIDGGQISQFYRSRGGAPLWFALRSGAAAQQLVQLLATAQADNLNPRRYNVRAVQRAVEDASRGDPAAIQRAEALLSAAFV
ncbi:MAG: L,D-transpeptidase YcbB, partial [Sphingomonadales bacterium]|nr:L,D-transpeptidase YcbB [Sphingomonadales bacterium]